MNLSQAFQKPSVSHWFGMDAFGQDLGIKILQGAKITCFTSISVACITVTLGLLFGSLFIVQKYNISIITKRIVDIFLAFPGLLLAILLASVLPAEQLSTVFALSVTGWAMNARIFGSSMQKISTESFVESAHSIGANQFRVLIKHIWPQLSNQIRIQFLFTISFAILNEAGLSFLGLGTPIDSPSWGRLIAEGRQYLIEAPHLSIGPGFVLFITLFSLYSIAHNLQKNI